MDLQMPEKGGIEGMPALLQALPTTKVLMLSMTGRPPSLRPGGIRGRRQRLRAQGGGRQGTRQAVREVAAGGRYVHPTLGARMRCGRRGAGGPSDPLSTASARCCDCWHSANEPGDREAPLHLGAHRRTHRAHIMQKLGLNTRAELVRYALIRGCSRGGSALGSLRVCGGSARLLSWAMESRRPTRVAGELSAVSTADRCRSHARLRTRPRGRAQAPARRRARADGRALRGDRRPRRVAHGARAFVTRGIDDETHAAIGDLPRGRGILGVLIERPAPAAARRRRRAPAVLRLPARPPADGRRSSASRS